MGASDAGRAGTCVAVDGGATGCRLAAFDASGARLGTTSVGRHASLSLDPGEAADAVREGLDRLGRETGVRPCGPHAPGAALVAGLAGSLRPERRDAFRAALGLECTIVTDGEAQLLGATGGRPGACLAVGTGSVLHWRGADGGSGMAGGWGFPVGDEGSAAWLGVELLRRYLRARDRSRVAGRPLLEAVERRVGREVAAVQDWTTCTRSTRLGTLARLVTAHAGRGDADAIALLEAGAGACLDLLEAAPAGLPRHLVGGLAPAYAPRLEARGVALAEARGDALDGLALLARGEVAAARPARDP